MIQQKLSGKLFIVATPIGNLGDITLRALSTLKEVDLLLCEDTRTTQHLLTHYKIETKKLSYHDHNKEYLAPKIIEKIHQGMNIALVSDAGTPLICDPGFVLVALAKQNNISVIPIPGASSVTTALMGCGLAPYPYYFGGFMPQKARLNYLKALPKKTTLVFFESPRRILKTLKDISSLWPDHPIAIAREITKYYEEFLKGTTSWMYDYVKEHSLKGEIVLIIAPITPIQNNDFEPLLKEALTHLSLRDAVHFVAQQGSWSKKTLYDTALKWR